MAAPLLDLQDLTIAFRVGHGIAPGVEGINLRVERGEIVALVGESGSGKSITALSILRLLPSPPAHYLSGKILFTDQTGRQADLLTQSPRDMQRIRGREAAMIFQEPMSSLNPVFTCGFQVTEAIRAHEKLTAGEARKRSIDLFEKVRLPDPSGIYSRYPHQLSGGQKQRVMIAMAMSCHPSLLICDEPTTALDTTVQKTILQLIRELQQAANMGVLFITHDLGVVAEIADRALVMYKGGVVEEGKVKDLFSHPTHPYTRGLLNCRPALHSKGMRLPVVSDFIQAPGAARVQPIEDRGETIRYDQSLVEVRNLRVWYPARTNWHGKAIGHTKAVDDVSFDVYKGETLGLVGESGCGKTTLGRALMRLTEPTAGQILFNGTNLGAYGAARLKQLRKDIQIIFQDPYSSLNPRLTIGSAITEALKVHNLSGGKRGRRQRVEELLQKVSMRPEHFGRYPHEFSGGQRQRIVIARALSLNPTFIVCDESVSALDVSVQAQVLNLLNDLKKEFGFTIVFISHDLSVVRYISDRIMVMNKGRIEEIGDAESLYDHPQTEYTRRLIAAIPAASIRK
ncbi:MAG: ABC transporter ATP-binding protein [Bacteroidota bacterium]|nr:ABC transporter ATP-binding protein [Bacteroidota bacterium]